MSTLAAEKVLRVNCPGFGVSSTLPLGEAKPLAMYEVIVINPTSIIHLFEPKSDAAKQAEKLLADGATSLKLDDDSQLESVGAELELREHELRQFLSKGGLLIYFLCPPFTVQGPSMQMDNYLWLYEWAPDKVQGTNRQMSATISGKNIDLTKTGKQHPFAPYLEQLGLEWSTIIRTENLAEGYRSLAGAGGPKSVAGYRSSGPKRGQVMFLPAPYDTRFDETLKSCITNWYEIHTGPDADKPEPEVSEDDDTPAPSSSAGSAEEGQALLNNLFGSETTEAAPRAESKEPESKKEPEPEAKKEPESKKDDVDEAITRAKDAVEPEKDRDRDSESKRDEPKESKRDEPESKRDSEKETKRDYEAEAKREYEDFKRESESKQDDYKESKREPEPERKREEDRRDPETVETKRKALTDWPEFDNDVPPFSKEREKEKEEKRSEPESKREPEPESKREEKREEPKRDDRDEPRREESKRDERDEPRREESKRDDRDEPKREESKRDDRDEPKREESKREPEPESRREPESKREPEPERKSEREPEVKRDPPRESSRDREMSSSPEAKELMSRMEQELSPNVPEWCSRVSFSELKQLETEMNDLHEQVRKAKIKMAETEDRTRALLELKNSLLALSGVRLNQACSKVFEELGWNVQISDDSTEELWLREGDKMHAIVRVVFASGQPSRSELAELSQSVITYWDKHDIEPKGILLASTYADRPPKHRTEEDFPTSLGEFAKRKNLCLLTCMQLLTMYRDVAISGEERRKIRENVLTTSGVLSGFKIDLWEATPAAR